MAYCGDSSRPRALRIQIWHGRQWACFSSDTLCTSVILGVHPGIGAPIDRLRCHIFVEQRPCYERFFLQKLHIILARTDVVRSHEALYLWPISMLCKVDAAAMGRGRAFQLAEGTSTLHGGNTQCSPWDRGFSNPSPVNS